MKILWQSVLSSALGFLGGIVAIQLGPRLLPVKTSSVIRAETVQASRFELLGGSDKVLAYWARDMQSGRILIAFLDETGTPRAEFGIAPGQLDNGKPSGFTPFTALVGSDGKVRLQERLDSTQGPVLAMGDGQTEGRLLLGHFSQNDIDDKDRKDPWDKWSLVFRDSSHGWKEYLDLGATTASDSKERTGYVVLRNSLDRRLEQFPK
jgi:hypothetical protein